MPWQVFLAIWLALLLVTLAWLTGPLLLLPAVVLLGIEIQYGNIHLFMAAAIVLGFRLSWTWALPLLTKVTPGVGLLGSRGGASGARWPWPSAATVVIALSRSRWIPAGWLAGLNCSDGAWGADPIVQLPGPALAAGSSPRR